MDTLTKVMKPRCFGRFLIDIPDQMVLRAEGGQEVEGVTLSVASMPENEFKNTLLAKKAEFEEKILPGEGKFPFLRSATLLPGETDGILFDRAASDAGTSRMGRVLELMAWRGGYSILASIKAVDTDFPEFANDAWIKESKTTTSKNRAILLDIFRRTRGRGQDEAPTEKGVCILNGFVAGPASASESVTMFYQLQGAEDVYFTLSTNSSYGRSESLVDRGKKAQSIIAQGEGRILRTGKHIIGGASDGEELLYKILGYPDSDRKQIMTYKFVFEANNKIGGANAPLIAIDLDNGEMKPMSDLAREAPSQAPITAATLTEAEAIALWDAVIPTVRPRPGAF